MKAMVLKKIGPVEQTGLELLETAKPQPQAGQILVEVTVCGVCHTELDEIEGRIPVHTPVIPGHQIVGRVAQAGDGAKRYPLGTRVGIAWINSACGQCEFCRSGRENLCAEFKATGCDVDGGYGQYAVVGESFAYKIPEEFSDSQAAPLLCAGAIGWRAVKLTGLKDGQTLGLFGFGSSAHLAIQLVKHQYRRTKVFVFTRAGQTEHQELARKLEADWVGATGEKPPERLNCAIDFTPAWQPIVAALTALEKGGRVVINAIRKEERDKESLLQLDYAHHLWQEKEIKSVANITRADAAEFLPRAAAAAIRPQVQEFPLEQANEALRRLKQGQVQGAAVLRIAD